MKALDEAYTYEKLYFSLWETAQRYQRFTNFRVIGKSHDERMIPMLEVGRGSTCVFCLSGVSGMDEQMPLHLTKMAQDYTKAYEFDWHPEDFYEVRRLLDEIRICFIPLLNPDGYEVFQKGYRVIQNPVHRQMLRMQNRSCREFSCNARGIDLMGNFPTEYYQKTQYREEPASENETKALIHMFQEYESRGLLSFRQEKGSIRYYKQKNSGMCSQKSHRLARHLQKRSGYPVYRCEPAEGLRQREREKNAMGTAEQYYSEMVKQPSLTIQAPYAAKEKDSYEEIFLLPLEYIFSLVS